MHITQRIIHIRRHLSFVVIHQLHTDLKHSSQPYTFLLKNSEQQVTHEMGINIHLGKGFLIQAKVYPQSKHLEKGDNPSKQTTIPHSPHASPTLESVPLLYSAVLWSPHFLSRASATGRTRSLRALYCNCAPWENNSL
jgi:hypothetical protein